MCHRCHQWIKIDGGREDRPGKKLGVPGQVMCIFVKENIFETVLFFSTLGSPFALKTSLPKTLILTPMLGKKFDKNPFTSFGENESLNVCMSIFPYKSTYLLLCLVE